MSHTPADQEAPLFETFGKGPDLVEEATRWGTAMVYSASEKLKDLETVPEETLSSHIRDLRSGTTRLIRQRLVPALQDSTATARVGALLSRQGQDVCRVGAEHLEEFLRGTAHLVWDCHQRTEKTAEQFRDIRWTAVNLLSQDPLRAQESEGREVQASPDNRVIASLENILHEIFSQNDNPFGALIDWWLHASMELHSILQNMSAIQFSSNIRLRAINKTWETLEYRYEDYKRKMDKALDATFGRNNGASIEVPNIDISAELPQAFLEWAEQQPGSNNVNTPVAKFRPSYGANPKTMRDIDPSTSNDQPKSLEENNIRERRHSWWRVVHYYYRGCCC